MKVVTNFQKCENRIVSRVSEIAEYANKKIPEPSISHSYVP